MYPHAIFRGYIWGYFVMAADKSNGMALLKDIQCRNAHLEEGKTESNYRDGGGLVLVVTAERKRWRFVSSLYGKRIKIWLGDYPALGLKQARLAAEECRDSIRSGKDPSVERKLHKEAGKLAQASTFEVVALEWLEEHCRVKNIKPVTSTRIASQLRKHIFPLIGRLPVDTLNEALLRKPVDLLSKQGHQQTAARVLQHISSVMKHAKRTSRIQHDPVSSLTGRNGILPVIVSTPKAALPLESMPQLLQKLRSVDCLLIIKLFLRFALLTGARSSEIRFARWNEFNLAEGLWTIPPEREPVEGVAYSYRGEKMGRPRMIFLSRQAIEVMQQVHGLNEHATFVFAGGRVGSPVSNTGINNAIRAMGYSTGTDQCLHGFRTTMTSALNEAMRFHRDAIELHIGHAAKNDKGDLAPSAKAIRDLYNRKARYLQHRQEMMQWYSDWLDELEKSGEFVEPADFTIPAS